MSFLSTNKNYCAVERVRFVKEGVRPLHAASPSVTILTYVFPVEDCDSASAVAHHFPLSQSFNFDSAVAVHLAFVPSLPSE